MDYPEPFKSALSESRPDTVGDALVATPLERYARGVTRTLLGRETEAREDFRVVLEELQASSQGEFDSELEPWCLLELAHLDLRSQVRLDKALNTGRRILEDADPGSSLEARTHHLLGLALGKLRRTADAVSSLLKARNIYREAGEKLYIAQVQDSLGQLYQSLGHLDLATGFYAQSIVDKILSNDRYGAAITLGNLGRLHLQAGRYDDAMSCFQQDLDIAVELADTRGQARMFEDLGRAYLEKNEPDQAENHFLQCLTLSVEQGYTDLELLARKDLALALLAKGEIGEAEAELARAEAILPKDAGPFHQALLLSVRGKVLQSQRDPGSILLLSQAAELFAKANVMDLEITTLLSLADASISLLGEADDGRMRAEQALTAALRRASALGHVKHLRTIREEIRRLGISTSGALIEHDRHTTDRQPSVQADAPTEGASSATAYTILEELGRGAFGCVYRAFDPVHDRIVAFKELKLNDLYDRERVDQCLRCAKVELEAASRIDHPGVARVYAIGVDEGSPYVVQEFIRGNSLRSIFERTERAEPNHVVSKTQQIASSLAALHEARVLHRDLKPENILIRTRDESCVLVDFGIAFVPGIKEAFERNASVGTLKYMAPEVLRGEAADPKADIYSFGVVLYEWLTGKTPQDLEYPLPLSQIRSDLEDPIESLVMTMLARLPAERPRAQSIVNFCRLYLTLPKPDSLDERKTQKRQ